MWNELLASIKNNNIKALARGISLIENEHSGYFDFLQSLPNYNTPVIGITGPPGAGKSTLTDALIHHIVSLGKKVAVLCIDPSSPFTNGALLGDRIRMNAWYNDEHVFIRSFASRGNVGGVNSKMIEITSLVQAAGFDYILIETVGAGQNEVEIASVADVTVVVLIPDSGDEIQVLKSGLMEIADIFVVNKSDRPQAPMFVKNLRNNMAASKNKIPVVQTIATVKQGIEALFMETENSLQHIPGDKKTALLAQKAFYILREERIKNISRQQLKDQIEGLLKKNDFNLYTFIAGYL
jgi:LAO/AO transport system kinase